jgi:hypothetical protein
MRHSAMILGFVVASAGLAVAGYQGMLWLQDGFWTPIPFSDLWLLLGGTPPRLPDLLGVERPITWLLNQPLSAILPVAGGGIAWIGTVRISYALN